MNAKIFAKVLHFLVFQEFLLFIFYDIGVFPRLSAILSNELSRLPPHPLQFLIPSNLLIEFLLHLVDEIGAAGILSQFDGGVVAVTLLGIEPEELIEGRSEHLQGCLAVVDATHLAQPVNQFYEVEGVARPLQGLLRFAFSRGNNSWLDVGCEWRHLGSGKKLLHLPYERESLADIVGYFLLFFGKVRTG